MSYRQVRKYLCIGDPSLRFTRLALPYETPRLRMEDLACTSPADVPRRIPAAHADCGQQPDVRTPARWIVCRAMPAFVMTSSKQKGVPAKRCKQETPPCIGAHSYCRPEETRSDIRSLRCLDKSDWNPPWHAKSGSPGHALAGPTRPKLMHAARPHKSHALLGFRPAGSIAPPALARPIVATESRQRKERATINSTG